MEPILFSIYDWKNKQTQFFYENNKFHLSFVAADSLCVFNNRRKL